MSTDTIPKPKRYNYLVHTKPENQSRLKNTRTVPSMNYTIREILDKFTTGQPINNMVSYNEFDGEYLNHKSETPDFKGFMPHPKTLDLVDRQRLAAIAKDQLKGINEKETARTKEAERLRTLDKEKINQLTQKIQILENPAGGTSKE